MRAPAWIVAVTITVALLNGTSLSAQSTNAARRNCDKPLRSNTVCSLTGTIVLRSVDKQRVLIGVDITSGGAPSDGVADHLFLYTGKGVLDDPVVGSSEFPGTATVRGGILSISATTDSISRQFGEGVSLAHYRLSDETITLELLAAANVSVDCPDRSGAVCVQLGSFTIRFPH